MTKEQIQVDFELALSRKLAAHPFAKGITEEERLLVTKTITILFYRERATELFIQNEMLRKTVTDLQEQLRDARW